MATRLVGLYIVLVLFVFGYNYNYIYSLIYQNPLFSCHSPCIGREKFFVLPALEPKHQELYYQHELMITLMHVLGYGGRNRVLSVIFICRKVGRT